MSRNTNRISQKLSPLDKLAENLPIVFSPLKILCKLVCLLEDRINFSTADQLKVVYLRVSVNNRQTTFYNICLFKEKTAWRYIQTVAFERKV